MIALYSRCSTQEQAISGLSIASQQAALDGLAAMRGFDDAVHFSDPGVSGTTQMAERPDGKRLVQAIESGTVKGVAVCRLDRAWRNVMDCLTTVKSWDERGVVLYIQNLGGSAVDTSSAMGRFLLVIMSALAAMERDLISERTSTALQTLMRQGVRVGNAPYGTKFSGPDVTDPASGRRIVEANLIELANLERMAALRKQGLSYRAIANALTAAGIKARDGGQWRSGGVHQILKREAAVAANEKGA